MTERFWAHTKPGGPEDAWEPLEEHLARVATLASAFAAPFGASHWAHLAGLWHDLGKYSNAFQRYLERSADADVHQAELQGKVDHSTAGAQHAVGAEPVLGHLLGYCISGHHSGLLDGRSPYACFEARLAKCLEPWANAPKGIIDETFPALPAFLSLCLASRQDPVRRGDVALSFAFFTRMLFSCLVDADFLSTEEFMDPLRAATRPAPRDNILERMERALNQYLAAKSWEPTPVNRERARVREACLAAAEMPPGLFSLTVPTGGGKTLSSLAFALRHAAHHGLSRIIYVAPFTTILEQNADEFRRALHRVEGIEPSVLVLEHHSNVAVGQETSTSRLAAENWDAPLVVTTSVQLYESLYANRTSRCRKLHRLARSVILLDEAQALPVDFLAPCLAALRELTSHYGSTVVLCTATQPAIERRPGFEIGLEGAREIMPERDVLFRSLRRVEVSEVGRIEDAELTERLLAHERVLCIVNTRSHARKLFERIQGRAGCFHLSALMCPAHRTEKLNEIRARLDSGVACRVISTQLIEAGVDIDFPVVYRSLSGIDSIAQAAGRCNRNGKLDGLGQTYVFQSEHERSEKYFAETADCARQILPLHEDPLSPEAIEHYFRLYYWDQSSRWDKERILDEFHLNQDPSLPFLFGFARVAERFRLLEDGGLPIVVPWREEGKRLAGELRVRWQAPDRDLHRRLQRYTVAIPARIWQRHAGSDLELLGERYALLVSPELHYSEEFGVRLEEPSEDLLMA